MSGLQSTRKSDFKQPLTVVKDFMKDVWNASDGDPGGYQGMEVLRKLPKEGGGR